MSKIKTVKMKFSVDQFYVTAANKAYDLANPKYRAGEVYEIPYAEHFRWLKRGGVIVTDEPKVEEKVEAPVVESQEPVETPEEKEEDVEKSVPQASHKSGKGKR